MQRGIVLLLTTLAVCWANEFSYDGANGTPTPDEWPTDFEGCAGTSQSPINIVDAVAGSDLDDFIFVNFDQVVMGDWMVENNGHSAQANLMTNVYFTSGGGLDTIYEASQFHFHWGNTSDQGSEHQVDGKAYPMEMHIVHFDKKFADFGVAEEENGAMVLGFFFEISEADNPNMAPLITAIEMQSIIDGTADVTVTPFSLMDLLPSDLSDYYRYMGSLTTPGCNQITTWTLFANTISISEAQMAAFRALMTNNDTPLVDNFRPVQPLNDRTIYRSTDSTCSAEGLVSKSISSHIQRLLLAIVVTVGLNHIIRSY